VRSHCAQGRECAACRTNPRRATHSFRVHDRSQRCGAFHEFAGRLVELRAQATKCQELSWVAATPGRSAMARSGAFNESSAVPLRSM
jgi:hypothetical protein